MKIMPPDDPTAVYPIGAVGFDTDEEPVENEATPPTIDAEGKVSKVPPVEPDLDSVPPEVASGGFNPLIALAVVGIGAVLAAMTIGLMGVILLLLQ